MRPILSEWFAFLTSLRRPCNLIAHVSRTTWASGFASHLFRVVCLSPSWRQPCNLIAFRGRQLRSAALRPILSEWFAFSFKYIGYHRHRCQGRRLILCEIGASIHNSSNLPPVCNKGRHNFHPGPSYNNSTNLYSPADRWSACCRRPWNHLYRSWGILPGFI